MDRGALRYHGEVIDLLSDDDDADFMEYHDAFDAIPGADDFAHNFLDLDDSDDLDDPNVIDLTAFADIPDIDVPAGPNLGGGPSRAAQDVDLMDSELITEAACLQMVLDVLPDISVDHVLNLIKEKTQDHTRTPTECQQIISQLLDGGAYPKEQDEMNSRKRKRDDHDDLSEFENGQQETDLPDYQPNALELLKDEFLDVPVRHLENVLREHKTLFKAYGIVEEQLRDYRNVANSFTKIRKARPKRGTLFVMVERGSSLVKELRAAKKKSENDDAKRRKAEDAARAEEDNLRQAQLRGEMGECLCCFDDVPINRMTSCDGDTVHFFCIPCAKKYVEGEMGMGRCRPVCFADADCGGIFTRKQLQEFLGDKSFDRLEHMQQQQDLAAAGLEFLSECPFCDYKAECPPIDEDKEFRCLNPKCRKTSCRLCQKETHIPLNCEEAKKDEQITVRHIVEEAMSAALIRQCNRCKHPFVKEEGCNKMTCTHCRNVQCYVCSQDVRDYQHFNDGRGRGCPLHDNVEARHKEEVNNAATEAMAKVRAENPEISEADLMVQVSDRVKQAEQARLGRAEVVNAAFPHHMAGGVLMPGRMARAPPPPPNLALAAQYVPAQPFHVVPLANLPYPYQLLYRQPDVHFHAHLHPHHYHPHPPLDFFGAVPMGYEPQPLVGNRFQAVFDWLGGRGQNAPQQPGLQPVPPPANLLDMGAHLPMRPVAAPAANADPPAPVPAPNAQRRGAYQHQPD